ncbi:transcription factor bHLH51 [Impatiens glandulifera]|uniref:transcription factor bHLH51 n=1 Tax=Impatiens glandulifera TaxID=253017 RepID=UPI001FB14044|nr:transcription factor bHLH51 [Impatiens glandulifera]
MEHHFADWCFDQETSIPIAADHLGSIPFGEDRSLNVLRSHRQAEKRRRDRINTQMSALRKMVPDSDKMDKAALLGNVIEQIKDLKKKATECISKSLTVLPMDTDEVTVDLFLDEEADDPSSDQIQNPESFLIRASLCCDDRPELFGELNQTLKSLNLVTVRADIGSLGGRVKGILVLCRSGETKGIVDNCCLNSIKQSLKGALGKIASTSSMASNYSIKSRRQRFFFPDSSSQCSTNYYSQY